MDRAGIVRIPEVRGSIQACLTEPKVGVPTTGPGQRGELFTREHVLCEEKPLSESGVAREQDTRCQALRLRITERGELADEFAPRRVWTTREGELAHEWLMIHRGGMVK